MKRILYCLLIVVCCLLLISYFSKTPSFPEDYDVIDLTHTMHEDMAYWPGGVPFDIERLVDYDQGYRLHSFAMGENTGTHIDAASHFIQGNHDIDDIPVEDLVVRAVVINVQSQVEKNPDYELTRQDIATFEEQYGKIPARSLVILNTGWHQRFSDTERYRNMDEDGIMHFPGFAKEAADLLLTRDVVGIGIDTLSLDHGPSTTFGAHQVMLNQNKYMIENLANLDALPPTGATIFVGALPIKDGTQAQARILGFVEK